MQSPAWKAIRQRVLKRDDFTCQYCGLRAESRMNVNHVDGNPKNHDDANLEVVCPLCHMILHSGLWAAVRKVVICFRRSKFSQAEIVSTSRKMRADGATDDAIIQYLGLEDRVPWKQDLTYLSSLYGFITSRPPQESPSPRPYLTEEEQRRALADRSRW